MDVSTYTNYDISQIFSQYQIPRSYMDPPESKQVMCILVLEELFFILSAARIRRSRLLGYNERRHGKHIIFLKRKKYMFY